MGAVIETKSISKSFGKKQALNNVSLSVNSGDIFGFLGPNGAGKTTTIRTLMDFIRPDRGSVKVFGQDVKDNPTIRQDIGYLSADNQLLDRWSAEEHIAFYSSIKGGGKNAASLAKRLDLDPKAKAGHMSTGNRQKLGFVLALLGTPKLLILDEPTRGLDPLLQNEIYAILKEFSADGGTVFFSSHNLSEVEHLCTSVAIIRAGHVVADKTMADIRAMKTHIVRVSFKQAYVVLPSLKDVEISQKSARTFELKAKGDLTPLMKEVVKHELADLEVVHAPLEDIFLEYYK